MIILSHRGFWRSPEEKNTVDALDRSVRENFGTETDVRDRDGHLVLAHDPATVANMDWADVVDRFAGSGLTLAVNIKADGLAPLLSQCFAGKDIDWFAFDMSAPEMLRYANGGLPFFTRHSDIEPGPVLYHEAQGVWLDAFRSTWFDERVIETHLSAGKRVCIVSPELHSRPYDGVWTQLRNLSYAGPELMLCTDFPDRAKDYFTT